MALSSRTAYARGKHEALEPLTGLHLVKPRLNLNGASAQTLIEEILPAISALTESLDAMRKCAPHGRDFQTQPQNVFEEAMRQHQERMRAVEKCRAELEEIALDVQHQSAIRDGK